MAHGFPESNERYGAGSGDGAGAEQPVVVPIEGRRALGDAERVWTREHTDRPSGADV